MTAPVPFLPELTRSLRARGSIPHDEAAAEEQRRYFAPLLDARRRAADASDLPEAARHFDPSQIEIAFRGTLRAIAAGAAHDSESMRRAVEARLTEAVDPLFTALALLGNTADPTSWCAALANVFRAADDCWFAVQRVLRGGEG